MLIKFYNKLTLDCFQHWRRGKKSSKNTASISTDFENWFFTLALCLRLSQNSHNFNHSGIFIMGWKNCFPHYFNCAFMFFIIAFRVWHCFVTRFTAKLRSGHFWVTFADVNDEKVATTQPQTLKPFSVEHESSWIENFKLALHCFDVSENARRITNNQMIFGLREFSRYHLKTFVPIFLRVNRKIQLFMQKLHLLSQTANNYKSIIVGGTNTARPVHSWW